MHYQMFRLTRHAAQRSAQRGFRLGDFEEIADIGTEVEGGYFVRRKDVEAEEHERLAGKRLVVDGSRIKTAYHASRSKERRLLRDCVRHLRSW